MEFWCGDSWQRSHWSKWLSIIFLASPKLQFSWRWWWMYMQQTDAKRISTHSELIRPLDDSLKCTVVPFVSFLCCQWTCFYDNGWYCDTTAFSNSSAFWRSRKTHWVVHPGSFHRSFNMPICWIYWATIFDGSSSMLDLLCITLLVVWPVSHQEFQGLERFLGGLTRCLAVLHASLMFLCCLQPRQGHPRTFKFTDHRENWQAFPCQDNRCPNEHEAPCCI